MKFLISTENYIYVVFLHTGVYSGHIEIRELKWSDFSLDLSQISLSGSRNKSGKNRIVPVPKFVIENLDKREIHHNIFSNQTRPYNPCYFKTLWTKYKRKSKLLEDNQTLYSFRHTGAINVY